MISGSRGKCRYASLGQEEEKRTILLMSRMYTKFVIILQMYEYNLYTIKQIDGTYNIMHKKNHNYR